MAIDELSEMPVPEAQDEPTADVSLIDDETAEGAPDDDRDLAEVDGSTGEN